MQFHWQSFAHATLFVLVAGLAWSAGPKGTPNRIIAGMFLAFAVANAGRLMLDRVLNPALPPYQGALIAAYYLDQGLELCFHVGFVVVCGRQFAKIPVRVGLYAYGAVWLALVVYKETTGSSLVPFHQVVAIVCTVLGLLLVARAISARADRFVPPDSAHAVLMLLLAADFVKVLQSYSGSYPAHWVQIRYLDLFVCIIIAVGYALAIARAGIRKCRTSHS